MTVARLRFALPGVLCLLLATGAAIAQEPGTANDPVAPSMSMDNSLSQVVIRGDISSPAHAAILQQTALNGFAEKEQVFDMQVRPALPPGWALLTEMTLRALADTHSATAEIEQSGVFVRGVTTSRERWEQAAARIGTALLPGMVLRQEIADIRPVVSLNKQCSELFRTSLRGRAVEFPRASSTLGTRAFPLLDELIQIAADCPAAQIMVTGHTDPAGNEESNIALSLARAEAVAAYMIAGGIDAERLLASAAGSSQSTASEKDSRSRPNSRRVEFDIKIP